MTGEAIPKPARARLAPFQSRLGDMPYIIAGVYFAWMALTVVLNLVTFWRGRSGRGWSSG